MMSDNELSSSGRVAAWVMRAALRLWPRESGDWGRALAAELPSTAGGWEAMRWTMGGLMVLMREWMRHAMGSWKRPIGVPAGGALEAEWKNAPRVPRTPRWVTAVLLVASACLLVTPDVRNGITKGLRAWRPYWVWDQDGETLAKLRREANRHHDPQLLAVLAIMSDDNNEKIRDAAGAVKADPSLTWIYSKIRVNEQPCCMLHPAVEEGIAALQKWDPDNAVPRFLATEKIFGRAEKEWLDQRERGTFNPYPVLDKDPAWRSAMDYAFAAPKYDSYSEKALAVYRSVRERYRVSEPEFGLGFMQRTALLWGLSNVDFKMYLDEGEEAERSGHLDAAVSLYWKPVRFAEDVLNQDHGSPWVNYEVINAERDAFQRLEPLLLKMGRNDEAKVVQYQLQSAQAAIENQNARWYWRRHRDGWAGLAIRSLAPAAMLFGIAIIASMCVLILRRQKESESGGIGLAGACLAIDFCPVLLLIAFAGLFAAYHPIALAYQQAVSSPWNMDSFESVVYAADAPYLIPLPLAEFSGRYLNAYHYWMASIILLSILAVYILFRKTLKRATI